VTRLVVGCGYLGGRVAERWKAADHRVAAVVHREARAAELTAGGIEAQCADVTRPETLAALPEADTVLYCVGYRPGSGRSRFDVYVGGLAHVLDALPTAPRRFVLVSSTGVYGEFGGGEVDEESPCRPTHEAGRALVEAERLLAAHTVGPRSIVLRLAGLYGPGRVPPVDDLRAGRPLEIDPAALLNLIHVDDAAAVVAAAAEAARPPRTYVVSDGRPVRRDEFYRELATILGAPEPRFAWPGAATRVWSNKRVNNRRMVEELGVALRYPSCAEGLRAIIAPSA
jgi:nucleoside-diphosphate-sugar epimerase